MKIWSLFLLAALAALSTVPAATATVPAPTAAGHLDVGSKRHGVVSLDERVQELVDRDRLAAPEPPVASFFFSLDGPGAFREHPCRGVVDDPVDHVGDGETTL